MFKFKKLINSPSRLTIIRLIISTCDSDSSTARLSRLLANARNFRARRQFEVRHSFSHSVRHPAEHVCTLRRWQGASEHRDNFLKELFIGGNSRIVVRDVTCPQIAKGKSTCTLLLSCRIVFVISLGPRPLYPCWLPVVEGTAARVQRPR
jgi:hypothetical protein